MVSRWDLAANNQRGFSMFRDGHMPDSYLKDKKPHPFEVSWHSESLPRYLALVNQLGLTPAVKGEATSDLRLSFWTHKTNKTRKSIIYVMLLKK